MIISTILQTILFKGEASSFLTGHRRIGLTGEACGCEQPDGSGVAHLHIGIDNPGACCSKQSLVRQPQHDVAVSSTAKARCNVNRNQGPVSLNLIANTSHRRLCGVDGQVKLRVCLPEFLGEPCNVILPTNLMG